MEWKMGNEVDTGQGNCVSDKILRDKSDSRGEQRTKKKWPNATVIDEDAARRESDADVGNDGGDAARSPPADPAARHVNPTPPTADDDPASPSSRFRCRSRDDEDRRRQCPSSSSSAAAATWSCVVSNRRRLAVVPLTTCFLIAMAATSTTRVSAQRFYYGQCPRTVPTASNFDLKRYLGIWYEVERYPSPLHAWGSCWSSTYQVHGQDNSVDLLIGGMLYLPSIRRGGRVYQEVRNDLWTFDMQQPAKFQYRVKDVPRILRSLHLFNGEYQVVDTDYDNWSIEWRCTDWPLGFRSEMLYIMSRRPQLENGTTAYVRRRLSEYKILDMAPLRRVNDGCTERRMSPTLG